MLHENETIIDWRKRAARMNYWYNKLSNIHDNEGIGVIFVVVLLCTIVMGFTWAICIVTPVTYMSKFFTNTLLLGTIIQALGWGSVIFKIICYKLYIKYSDNIIIEQNRIFEIKNQRIKQENELLAQSKDIILEKVLVNNIERYTVTLVDGNGKKEYLVRRSYSLDGPSLSRNPWEYMFNYNDGDVSKFRLEELPSLKGAIQYYLTYKHLDYIPEVLEKFIVSRPELQSQEDTLQLEETTGGILELTPRLIKAYGDPKEEDRLLSIMEQKNLIKIN